MTRGNLPAGDARSAGLALLARRAHTSEEVRRKRRQVQPSSAAALPQYVANGDVEDLRLAFDVVGRDVEGGGESVPLQDRHHRPASAIPPVVDGDCCRKLRHVPATQSAERLVEAYHPIAAVGEECHPPGEGCLTYEQPRAVAIFVVQSGAVVGKDPQVAPGHPARNGKHAYCPGAVEDRVPYRLPHERSSGSRVRAMVVSARARREARLTILIRWSRRGVRRQLTSRCIVASRPARLH